MRRPNSGTLHYSTPRLFFAGTLKYRTPLSLFGALAGLTFATLFGFVAVSSFRQWHGWIGFEAFFCLLFGAGSCFFFLWTGSVLYFWCVNRKVTVRITEEGVEYGCKLWTWPRIGSIGGVVSNGGVAFVMLPSGNGPRRNRMMPVTPALSERQFIEVITEVKTYLSTQYPHVSVDLEPRPAESNG